MLVLAREQSGQILIGYAIEQAELELPQFHGFALIAAKSARLKGRLDCLAGLPCALMGTTQDSDRVLAGIAVR
jgi:hypothetical protein